MLTESMNKDNSFSSKGDSPVDVEQAEASEAQSKKAKISKQATKHVYLSMLVVMIMIAVTAGIVLGFTFLFLSQEEEDDFKHGFQQQANVIAEASKFHAMAVQASLAAMSDSITSFATFTSENLNYSWPYITVPDFDRRGERALKEAYLEMVAFSPLVSHEDRHEWALYSANNHGWLGGNSASHGIASEIYRLDDSTGQPEVDSTRQFTAPMWQTTPKPHDPSLVNFNVLSEPMYDGIFRTMREFNHMAWTAVYQDDHIARTFFDPVQHDEHHNHHAEQLGMGTRHEEGEEGQSSGHGEDHSDVTSSHAVDPESDMQGDNHDSTSSSNMDHMNHEEDHSSMTSHEMSLSETAMPSETAMNVEDHSSVSSHNMSLVGETVVPSEMDVHGDEHSSMSPQAISPETPVPSETVMHGDDHSGHRDLANENSHSVHDNSHQASSSGELWAFTRPHSVVMAPVYDSFSQENRSLSGIIHGILAWEFYLTDLLPPAISGILVVLQNSCDQKFTFVLEGAHAEFIGDGDLHDPSYDDLYQDIDLASSFVGEEDPESFDQCFYSMRVYPSKKFQATFESSDTEKFIALFTVVFSMLALFFLVFVIFVQRRQRKVMGVATRTTAILSNLFPEEVRDRIMEQAEAQAKGETEGMGEDDEANLNLKNLLQKSNTFPFFTANGTTNDHGGGNFTGGIHVLSDAPIADLYPHCTVFFADIVGFTAWSSNRDPSAVFVLLETLYGEMNLIARRRRVFKVETIGDCYVAVTGLPKPRNDHAAVMAKFAADCLSKSRKVFSALAPKLGADTTKLDLRLGIHSGSVTAGVLRGEKGRFQLFGDTVNTAARMESLSRSGSIHCSKATADLLIASGNSSWLTERPDKINPKGKEEMTSYWVHPKSKSQHSRYSGGSIGELTASTSTSHELSSRVLRHDPSLVSQRLDPSSFESVVDC